MSGLRIYADFNGIRGPDDGPLEIPLDTRGSLRDLTNAGIRLRDGTALHHIRVPLQLNLMR
jgi:hypothetical protein